MLHDGKSWSTFDLPNKSGLASSSAYTVGLLRVCTELDKVTIAGLATIWEQDKMNGLVGSQDQYLCSVGGFHLLRFSEHGIRDKEIDQAIVEPLQDYLMLFDTHQYRMGSFLIADQLARMKENEDTLSLLAKIVDEGMVALTGHDYKRFGELLGESWELKKKLATTVSTPEIDAIYEKAIEAGATGGKLLGGGGGGFILFLCEPEKQEKVKQALSDLTYVPFRFETEGTKILYRGEG